LERARVFLRWREYPCDREDREVKLQMSVKLSARMSFGNERDALESLVEKFEMIKISAGEWSWKWTSGSASMKFPDEHEALGEGCSK
jgi:hypothetical protein